MEFVEFFVYSMATVGVVAILYFWIVVVPQYILKLYRKRNETPKQ